jgi:hypothetical protein
MRFRRILILTAAVLPVYALAAPTATADSSQCTPGGCAGKAVFVSLGEHLQVTDAASDGHSAVAVYWPQGGTGPFTVWNHGGQGTTVDGNLDLAEGAWIYYYVCLGEYGTREILTATCSAGVTDYA